MEEEMTTENVPAELDQVEAERQSRLQQQLKAARDAVERLETGLPNAQGLVDGIKAKQEKKHRAPNSPLIPAGDPEEAAKEEWEKYGGLLGIEEKAEKVLQERSEKVRKEIGPKTVRLDPVTLLEVEVNALRKKLALANEKLALVALSDAKIAKQKAEQEEASLMRKLGSQFKLKPGSSIRLVDREKGTCLIEE